MNHKKCLSLLLALLMAGSLLAACDKNPDDELESLPVMESIAEGVELERDAKGMTESERQHVAYAEEQWGKFVTRFEDFGGAMDKYVDDIFEKAIIVEENKDYLKSRDELLSSCKAFEKVDPAGIPDDLRPLYDKLVLVANRCRYLISQIHLQNGVNLPEDYNALIPMVQDANRELTEFFNTCSKDGLSAAAGLIPPMNWETERSREVKTRPTFNVFDLGIRWGASRYEVMGVEGLVENGIEEDVLSYPAKVYYYEGVRRYHFNEYGQLDSYTYEMDPNSYDTATLLANMSGAIGEPIYDAMYAISPILMYAFEPENYSMPIPPVAQDDGSYLISMDQPAETVTMQGFPNDLSQPIVVTVSAKTRDAE